MTTPLQAHLPNDSGRHTAVNSLIVLERRGRYLKETLDKLFTQNHTPDRDRQFATELACGTCRQRITLDHLIGQYSTRPARRIDPLVMQILRVGLFQLLYLDRTADFAAVDQAVSQAKTTGLRGVDGFVNAVLRSIQRDLSGSVTRCQKYDVRKVLWIDENKGYEFKKRILPDPQQHPAKYIKSCYAHPLWLIERWLKRYDLKTVQNICLTNNTRPLITIRTNPLRCQISDLRKRFDEAGLQYRSDDRAIQLIAPVAPQRLPGFSQGYFTVQDLAAISVAKMLNPQKGQRILDYCAAPGGKTTHMAELMENEGTIIANDVSSERLSQIDENCRRLGIHIVQSCLVDQLDRQTEPFDAVLVDVPCSNTGVLSRRCEARHFLTPSVPARLAGKQLDILQQAAKWVKIDGMVLYSTCSIEPIENERVVEKFLEANRNFKLIEDRLTLPGVTEHILHDGGYAALLGRGK